MKLNHYEVEIVRFIATYCRPFTAGEISRRTGFSYSTIKKYLETLKQQGYVKIDKITYNPNVCKTYWSFTVDTQKYIEEKQNTLRLGQNIMNDIIDKINFEIKYNNETRKYEAIISCPYLFDMNDKEFKNKYLKKK